MTLRRLRRDGSSVDDSGPFAVLLESQDCCLSLLLVTRGPEMAQRRSELADCDLTPLFVIL